MIIDKIENIERYARIINTNLIKTSITNELYKIVDSGKFSIENNDDAFFGIRLKYDTKDSTEGLWEAHQKYLDIHVVLAGEEIIEITTIEKMKISQEYDEINDYALFKGNEDQKILLSQGEFLLLFPNEVHKTGIKINTVKSIEKVVFKQKI